MAENNYYNFNPGLPEPFNVIHPFDHRSDVYLEDLKDESVAAIVQGIATKIDAWATTIRYAASILSSQKAVAEVLEHCEQLIELAKSKTPEKNGPPAGDVKDMLK